MFKLRYSKVPNSCVPAVKVFLIGAIVFFKKVGFHKRENCQMQKDQTDNS